MQHFIANAHTRSQYATPLEVQPRRILVLVDVPVSDTHNVIEGQHLVGLKDRARIRWIFH
jgi:hypothetical protein